MTEKEKRLAITQKYNKRYNVVDGRLRICRAYIMINGQKHYSGRYRAYIKHKHTNVKTISSGNSREEALEKLYQRIFRIGNIERQGIEMQ